LFRCLICGDAVEIKKSHSKETVMHMSNESILVILVVGLIAGWLAGKIVEGTGLGVIGDLVIGVLGAFIGGWLLPELGINLGAGIISAIITALIGAIVLLVIIKLIRGGSNWGRFG
jgi:uncharacterized membrane protein YeaQ/YmgE (transglycosylase-associated protein family)